MTPGLRARETLPGKESLPFGPATISSAVRSATIPRQRQSATPDSQAGRITIARPAPALTATATIGGQGLQRPHGHMLSMFFASSGSWAAASFARRTCSLARSPGDISEAANSMAALPPLMAIARVTIA